MVAVRFFKKEREMVKQGIGDMISFERFCRFH